MTRRGFTLIELLASMALTTLLMLAIFQVLASVARQGRALAAADRSSIEPWQADLINTIRWDLSNAVRVAGESNHYVIQGHGSLDRATLEPRHVPTEVTYRVSRGWLERREKPGDASPWTAMVCPDIVEFEIRAADDGPPEDLSQRYVLRVGCADGKSFSETIVLR